MYICILLFDLSAYMYSENTHTPDIVKYGLFIGIMHVYVTKQLELQCYFQWSFTDVTT